MRWLESFKHIVFPNGHGAFNLNCRFRHRNETIHFWTQPWYRYVIDVIVFCIKIDYLEKETSTERKKNVASDWIILICTLDLPPGPQHSSHRQDYDLFSRDLYQTSFVTVVGKGAGRSLYPIPPKSTSHTFAQTLLRRCFGRLWTPRYYWVFMED